MENPNKTTGKLDGNSNSWGPDESKKIHVSLSVGFLEPPQKKREISGMSIIIWHQSEAKECTPIFFGAQKGQFTPPN